MAKSKTRKPRSNAAAYKKMAMEKALFDNALHAEYAKMFNQGLSAGYGTAVLVMFWLLHTEHGFGKKRLAVFMRKISDFCLEMLGPGPDGQQKPKEGEFAGISLQDIADQLAEECGVYINPETWVIEADGIEVVRVEEGAADDRTGQAETTAG